MIFMMSYDQNGYYYIRFNTIIIKTCLQYFMLLAKKAYLLERRRPVSLREDMYQEYSVTL